MVLIIVLAHRFVVLVSSSSPHERKCIKYTRERLGSILSLQATEIASGALKSAATSAVVATASLSAWPNTFFKIQIM